MSAPSPLSVVIVDDDEFVAQSLRTILEARGSVRVAALGTKGAEAAALFNEHHPDIMLLDIRMPDLSGLAAGEAILAAHPKARIVFLTTFADDDYIVRALAMEPDVMLFDEPTSALDPISTSKIEDLVMDIKKDYTIVMVTHNMHQALTLGNRTLMMNAGNIVLDVAGEERAAMSVDDLLEQFALRAGKALDNDRILFSKVETQE